MVAFILGAGGLLGRSVATVLKRHGEVVVNTPRIDWLDRGSFLSAVRAGLKAAEQAADDVATVYWCAGAGHVAVHRSVLVQETALVDILGRELAAWARHSEIPAWRLVFASSAGAAWAGAPSFPVSESSRAYTTHAYGEAKLQQEEAVRRAVEGTRVTALVARISNLYGPLQDLRKPQGLLSHLVTNALLHRPTHIFVPLDTIRDYLPSTAGAEMLRGMSNELSNASSGQAQTRIVASENQASIAMIIGILSRLLKRRVPVTLGERPEGRHQPRVLSFKTEFPSQLAAAAITLEEGINDLIRHRVCAGIAS